MSAKTMNNCKDIFVIANILRVILFYLFSVYLPSSKMIKKYNKIANNLIVYKIAD